MIDISTNYLGLLLKNPVIVGSSGLTNTAEKVKKLEDAGAGAVVLKSIFEEEIVLEYEDVLRKIDPKNYCFEQLDYYDYQIKEQNVKEYTALIKECKNTVSIPVIASVNCTYSHEWAFFAKKLEQAGADAIELNMFFLPSDFKHTSEEKESAYFKIIDRVKSEVNIPVSLKISYYFSNLGSMIKRLSETGVSGIVLFNRFFNPDFDINNFKVITTNVLSTPEEFNLPLRWIAMLSNKIECDLAASTGVHDGNAIIKQILAGAKAVQVVSSIYREGNGCIQNMLSDLKNWMNGKGFKNIEQFRGKMSHAVIENPAVYERVQFMKYFGS